MGAVRVPSKSGFAEAAGAPGFSPPREASITIYSRKSNGMPPTNHVREGEEKLIDFLARRVKLHEIIPANFRFNRLVGLGNDHGILVTIRQLVVGIFDDRVAFRD
jgi:hypothetical protein